MAVWIEEEAQQARAIAREIERHRAARRTMPAPSLIVLNVAEAEPLKEGLAGDCLLIRQLYHALNFDEYRPFRWRLEHKLVQSLILNHYCPGSVPLTCGLGAQLRRCGPQRLRQVLHEEFPNGFYIKPALGSCSGERGISDVKEQLLQEIGIGGLEIPDSAEILYEDWIVQERIPIVTEYRVHSLEDRVIEDLTFWRYVNGDPPAEEAALANAYVQSLLDQMPAAMIGHCLHGWDVALTEHGTFMVVELNLSGFHPVYECGFQCSGFFQDPTWGPKSVAHLLRFVEKINDVTIIINAGLDDESEEQAFYSEVGWWKQELASRELPSESCAHDYTD